MTDFYNIMNLDATTLGNHEWDWGKDRIINLMNNAHYKYLIANMERKSPSEIAELKAKITDKSILTDLDKPLEDLV
jgi:2',3'-cyclic-nucleotide 2'-phosphodiesterase (5'-nucleotidase family)